jgi:hypothetical protein
MFVLKPHQPCKYHFNQKLAAGAIMTITQKNHSKQQLQGRCAWDVQTIPAGLGGAKQY